MDLAKAVRINGRVSNSVILEYGVENEFLNFVEHRALNIDALSEPLSDMHALKHELFWKEVREAHSSQSVMLLFQK